MRPCRSNMVAGSLNSPNRGFSKYFASLSSSTDVPFSDWGCVFLTRSANRSTSQSVWTDNKSNTITNTTPLKKQKNKNLQGLDKAYATVSATRRNSFGVVVSQIPCLISVSISCTRDCQSNRILELNKDV